MDEKRLTRFLHEIAQEEIPDDMNLMPNIHAVVRQTSRWSRLLPKSRIGQVVATIVVLLCISAGVYSLDYVMQILDPGLQAADDTNLITYFNETQSSGDVSVTLQYAYADANRIAVAYGASVLVPVDQSTDIGFTSVRLTDDQGREFSDYLVGGGGGGGGGSSDTSMMQVAFQAISNYDASIIDDFPESLHLQLELTVGGMPEQSPLIENTEEPTQPISEAAVQPFETVTFTFEFTIPFNAGLVMDNPQTVTAADIPMTLNRVVVTESLTGLEMCFEQPQTNASPYWVPVASLAIDGEEVMPPAEIGRDVMATDSESCVHYNLTTVPHERAGEWVLNVEKLLLPGVASQEEMRAALRERGIETIDQPGGGWTYDLPADISHAQLGDILQEINATYKQTIEGPWTFTFSVE